MKESRESGNLTARGSRESKVAWPRRPHILVFAGLSIAFAVCGSLVPLRFAPMSLSAAASRFSDILAQGLYVRSRADWVANVLLFLPIGFFTAGTLCVDRRRRWALLATVPAAVFCAALSVATEFTQLWFPQRSVSPNDIVAETVGAVLGCLLWGFAGQTLTDWLRTFTRDAGPKRHVDWLLQAYLLGLVVYCVLPLDFTISLGRLYDKFRDGRFVVVPFSHGHGEAWLYQTVKHLAVFAPVGAWSATVFIGRGRQVRTIGHSVLIGALIVIAIESAQMFVFSRYSDVTDLLTGTAGVALGAALTRRLLGVKGSPPAGDGITAINLAWLKWLGIAALYTAFLTAGYWSPFDFSADKAMIRERLGGFFDIPSRAVLRGSEFDGIWSVLQTTLPFAPLGSLVTVAACRMPVPETVRRIVLAGLLLVCSVVSLGIELGQIVLPRHTAKFTDVILCTAGVLVGMLVTLRYQRGRV